MQKRRISTAVAGLLAGVLSVATLADLVRSEYKPGDLATEDIISPTTIQVPDSELSDVLKNRSAARVPPVFRYVVTAAEESERELRGSVDAARTAFLDALRQALHGRNPGAGDVGSPAYASTIREATRVGAIHPPFSQFAPLWVRGISDAALVEALLQPVRDVMAQPVVDEPAAEPLSVDQPIRLVRVNSRLEAPGLEDLEGAGVTSTAAKLSSLELARSVMASYFPSEQEEMAQFAATFLRANAFPAPGLTEFLRSRRRDGVIKYDTYKAGQVIVRKGQVIDEKAVAALAALREKKLIETLLTKVETKPSVDSPDIVDTQKFVAWFGTAGFILLLVLWRWGGHSASAATTAASGPVIESPALLAANDAEGWRTRALLAEQRAERAQNAIRQGALGWLKERLFRSVFRQRAELLSTQQLAEAELVELERRLAQLLTPLQERLKTYENRIKELEGTLADQEGNDRRLIDARISRTRQQLEWERARAAQDF